MLTRQANADHGRESFRMLTMAAILAFFLAELILSESALARQAGPDVIYVPGIVRDFRRDHPDFNIVPASGYGHYAGNMDLDLGADGRPAFDGDGFKVDIEWFNKFNQPIAPHLYMGVSPIQLSSAPLTAADTTIDSWDPDDGLYGVDGNVGPAPDIIVGASMPTITPPTDLGPSIGDYILNPGVDTVTASFRCDNFDMKNSSLLQIDGDVTILCDNSFSMQTGASIELLDGARLILYVGGMFQTFQGSTINTNTLDPERVMIYYYGNNKMDISQYSEICATILAPFAVLDLGQDVHFYGTFYGLGIDMKQGAAFHSPGAEINDSCGILVEDRFGVPGNFTPGGITSNATFNEWYNDVLGTNLSMLHTIQMVRDGAGLYQAQIADFHPIDDRLYGNEGDIHNRYFTYTFNATFTYEACSNQFFAFGGADDAWLYIDNQLAIDLGGVIPGTPQVVELDRLNLTDGDTYSIRFFYAQRNPTTAMFDFQTNIVVAPLTLTATGTASFD